MNAKCVRRVLLPLHERLRGRKTFAYLDELQSSQWRSADELHTLQTQKLQALLDHSSRKIPYYRELLGGPFQSQYDDPWSVLARLPLLDKATIRSRRQALCCPEVPGGLIEARTGGSTGEPLKFYLDRRRQAYDKAARMRTHEWFGVHPGDKEIYLWGSPWEIRRQDRLRSVRDRLTNERLLSAFDLSEDTMARYLRVIDRYRPASIFGYPSSLVLLCEFASRQGLRRSLPSLRAVFVTGEVCDQHQRDTIESYFQVPVANGYGSREAGFIAHECPSGTMHVTDENVIVEIVDPAADSERAADFSPRGLKSANGPGEIVVTHLDNYGMPMIRYRTGDLGRHADTVCACGRALTALDAIQGRKTDHLVASDGSLSHGLSLIYVLRDMDRVRQFQIHQRADLDLLIRIVADAGFNGRHHERILSATHEQLGAGVGVCIEQVDQIAASASGKHRCVTSEAFVALSSRSALSGADQS